MLKSLFATYFLNLWEIGSFEILFYLKMIGRKQKFHITHLNPLMTIRYSKSGFQHRMSNHSL